MKVSVIGFTLPGLRLALQIGEFYVQEGNHAHSVKVFCGSRSCYERFETEKLPEVTNTPELVKDSLRVWAGREFSRADLLIFVGAAGIAVRGIAPFVKDKKTDPAVLVCDEKGQFVIPILSGHLGGANACATWLAERLQATPVLTTASDVEGKLALDVWAKQQELFITDRNKIKERESALLRGEPISILVEDSITDMENLSHLPEGIQLFSSQELARWNGQQNKIRIGVYSSGETDALWLIPRNLVIGIGCRRGKSFMAIEKAVTKLFRQRKLPLEAVRAVASIDRKAEEAGICEFATFHHLPYRCYTAQELQQVEGTFQHSDFVEQTVGIDNVCERAALRALQEDEAFTGKQLIIEKQAADGITLAVALGTRRLTFG